MEQLFKRVRVEVMEKTGERQVPWESSSLTGDFMFIAPAPVTQAIPPAPAAEPATPDPSAEIEFWKAVAGSDDPAQVQTYLDQYPNGLFAGLAKQRLVALDAARQRAGETKRQADAAALWATVKDSGEPALLETVIARYGDTVYAELARVKIDALKARSERAQVATAPTETGPNADILFWESIKDSPNQSDYQAYLAQFPDGTFAAIARDRAANGYSPIVAAVNPAAPFDGVWSGTFERGYLERGDRYPKFAHICKSDQTPFTDVRVEDGEIVGGLVSPTGESRTWRVEVSPGGAVSGKIGSDIRVRGTASGNGMSLKLTHDFQGYGGCDGVLTLSRAGAAQTASLGATTSAPPLPSTPEPTGHPFDGDWLFEAKIKIPNPQASWCRWGEAVSQVITLKDGELDGTLKSNQGKSAKIKLSVSENGAVKLFIKPSGWVQNNFYDTFEFEDGVMRGDIFMTMSNARCHQEYTMRRP